LERTLRLAVPNDGVLSRFISKKYATRLAFRKARDVLAKPKQGEVKGYGFAVKVALIKPFL
jgi:hypothetical protein